MAPTVITQVTETEDGRTVPHAIPFDKDEVPTVRTQDRPGGGRTQRSAFPVRRWPPRGLLRQPRRRDRVGTGDSPKAEVEADQ